MTITFNLDYMTEKAVRTKEADVRRTLQELAGVRLSAGEAREVMPRIQNHKWYISERLGRDVGLKVAAIDYFDNIHEQRANTITLRQKLNRLAKDFAALYLTHQSWKAHDGLFQQSPDTLIPSTRGDIFTERLSL